MSTLSPGRSLKYEQLAQHFREQVLSGQLLPGHQLPTFAQMQTQYGIGQGTLERVYALLESEKLVVRQPKRGTFVAQVSNRAGLNVVGVATGAWAGGHPYYSLILQGIHEVANRERIELLHLHEDSSIKWEKMDGLMTIGKVVQTPSMMPVVSMLHALNGMPCILADECGGIRTSVEYLISQGHRKIAYLHLPDVEYSRGVTFSRMRAFRAALTDAGIKPVRRWERTLREPWEPTKGFADLGYEKVNQWLAEDWEKLGCTALLAQNDDTAIGVMRAFREAGLRIPEDISIIGFDGTEVSEHVRPTLSTVKMPLCEIGARGMELLLKRIQASNSSEEVVPASLTELLPTRLEVRGSSGPAPGPG